MNFRFRIRYLCLAISLVAVTGLLFESSVGAQSSATNTVTSTSTFSLLNTTTITTLALQTRYTTMTSSVLSAQTQGTTITQYLTQTVALNNTIENSMTAMISTTSTIVETETENASVLASALGEIFVTALALVSVFSLAVPRILAYRERGRPWICEECGFSNPAFARSFCVRCGSALSRSK